MSHKLYKLAQEAPLPLTEKFVLTTLADFAGNDGDHIWPSYATIARKTSMHECTAKRAVKNLIVKGYLSIIQPGGRAQHDPNHYAINVEFLEQTVLGIPVEIGVPIILPDQAQVYPTATPEKAQGYPTPTPEIPRGSPPPPKPLTVNRQQLINLQSDFSHEKSGGDFQEYSLNPDDPDFRDPQDDIPEIQPIPTPAEPAPASATSWFMGKVPEFRRPPNERIRERLAQTQAAMEEGFQRQAEAERRGYQEADVTGLPERVYEFARLYMRYYDPTCVRWKQVRRVKYQREAWVKEWDKWLEMGLTAQDIETAIHHIQKARLTVTWPGSVTDIAYAKKVEQDTAEQRIRDSARRRASEVSPN